MLAGYTDRTGIVVSHSILRYHGGWSANGQRIFDALKYNPNMSFMLCGHDPYGESRRFDIVNNNTILTILANYQFLGNPRNGEGYMRIMTFSPKDNNIQFETYSPVLDSYFTDTDSYFILDYPMLNYSEIGRISSVTGGSYVTIDWLGMENDTKYYWYADVVDNNSMTNKSEVWQFFSGILSYLMEDLNKDGHVNLLDLQIITMDFGRTSGYDQRADIIPNNEIDIFDVVYVASRFN